MNHPFERNSCGPCSEQVVRSGVTFKYGPNGPEGLVKGNKKVYVVSASGGNLTESSLLYLPSHFVLSCFCCKELVTRSCVAVNRYAEG